MTTLTERLREENDKLQKGTYYDAEEFEGAAFTAINLAQELHALLVECGEALKAGKLCASLLSERGGACGTEIREEELPTIEKALTKLKQAGIV